MPVHLQAAEGNSTHSSHPAPSADFTNTRTVHFLSSSHSSCRANSWVWGKSKSPSAHSHSARHYVPERRESCCTTQTMGVTHCPPTLSRSPLGVVHHSKQNFPLSLSYIPLEPNHQRTALEHVTPKPEQETLCAPHMAPLGHFGCICILALSPSCVSAALKHPTPRGETGRAARSHIKPCELSGVAFKAQQEKIPTATLEVRRPHTLRFHDATRVIQN